MFGRKAKLEKLRANAKADFLRCTELGASDRYNRMFVSRIAMRAKGNLDKIFVQGAKAEEKRQEELAIAVKEAKKNFPGRKQHDGYNTLRGTTGVVLSWVPEEYANAMYNLGADYQIQEKSARECIAAADQLAERMKQELQTLQKIELLNLLRLAIPTSDTNEEIQNQE